MAVYNVKPYLRECLVKLQEQTLQQAEFIVVDDGSTDGSSAICDEFAKTDRRFRVIHHDGNCGSLVARKTGIEAARGRYTTFLDGDDYYVTPESLSTLARVMEERQADILRFECECFGNNSEAVRNASHWMAIRATWEQCSAQEALRAVFVKGELCWNVIVTGYRTAVLKKVATYLPEVRCICAEDAYQFFLTVCFSNGMAAVKTGPLYAYRVGSGVSTSAVTLCRVADYAKEIRIARWIEDALTGIDVSIEWRDSLAALRQRLMRTATWRLNQLPDTDQPTGFDWLAAEKVGSELIKAMRAENASLRKMGDAARNLYGAESLKASGKTVKTVAILYHRFYDGGVERVMSLQILELLAAGRRVVLITEEVKPDIEYSLPATVEREVLPARYEDGRAEALEAILKRHNVDTVMYHQASSHEALWDLLLIKLCGVAAVVQLHELPGQDLMVTPSVEQADFETARPYIYRLADRLLVLSETFKLYFESFGCRVSVVPNPPTFDLGKTLVLPVSERRGVLWLGRLHEAQKNWTDALRVMELLTQRVPGVQCFMGGSEYDEGSEARVKQWIADRHLEQSVHWLGRCADVRSLLSRCRVFLMTSSFETFPMVLAEAKACGAPVVVYDMPYLELLQSDAGCQVVCRRDTEAAASAAAEILRDDALCERLIRESRASVETYYRQHVPTAWMKAVLEKDVAPKVPRNQRLQQCFEYLTGLTQSALSVQARAQENRRHSKIRTGRVLKYAILGKIALTHEKRQHYRDKLRKLFE